MRREGKVLFKGIAAGVVWQDDDGYGFAYNKDYLESIEAKPISLTLPVRAAAFRSNTMLPFFDGLIPEGWLLNIVVKNWKISDRDRMGLLLTACKDCIGAVSIETAGSKEK